MTAQALGATTGAFIGRAQELKGIQQLLEGLRSGGTAAVAVLGEMGIGKTRLLGEFGRIAATAGCTVLTGRASELEPDAPFGPFVEALDETVGDLDPVGLRRLGDERLAELSQVFPSLAGRGAHLTGALDVERYRCHYAIRAGLEQLVLGRPLVLVLDDVHWADPASVELISYLLRKPVKGMLLALACRARTGAPLSRVIDRAGRERALHLIELGPLTRDEAAALLGDAVVPPSVDALYAESGGNPFYLEQLAKAPSSADLLLPVGARPTSLEASVPPAVRIAIEQELSGLSSPSRHLAHAAAVAGDPFDVDMAREVAGMEEPTVWTAVDELVTAGVVQPTEVPGRLLFRHPLTRRAVYDAAGHGWRVQAHRRAANALARWGAPLGAQAQHVVRSAVAVGDQEAIALLCEASRAVGPRAPATAAHWLQAAERLLPSDGPANCRLGLQVGLATSFAMLGRPQDSRALLLRALDLLPASDTGGRVRLTTMLARIEHQLGQSQESRRLLREALAESRPGSPEAAALTLELAHNHSTLKEWDQAASAADDALSMARSLDDRELTVNTEAANAFFGAFRLGTVAPARAAEVRAGSLRCMAAAAGGIDGMADEELTPQALEALVLLVQTEILHERWVAAEAHARRGVRVCRATGQGERFLYFTAMLAPLLMYQGRLTEACESVDVVAEALHLVENNQTLIHNESMRCWATSLLGQTNRALAAGADAVHAAERTPHAQFAWLSHMCYGEALVEAGRHEAGRARLLAAGGPELADTAPSARPHWLRVLTQAELAGGRIEAAAAAAAEARDIAEQIDRPMRTGDARYAEAAVLLARDDTDVALARARESTDAYRDAAVPIEAARARMLAGLTLTRAGDTQAAVDDLEAAHATFVRYGAVRLTDSAARELRRLGRRVTRRVPGSQPARSGPSGLSRREREVADLVAKGLTTRQVAQELYVSPKTIETHLAHIYAKLGVSSRIAMAAVLDGAGDDET